MNHNYDNLDTSIYRFNQTEAFTIRQAFEGVQIFGGIGSGKTSGSGQALAKAYLHAGFGGLVLCAKKDECETWKEYARETGREDDLIIFDETGSWRFPFLQYEVKRAGKGAGFTENLVRLFTTVYEVMERSKGGNSDSYWMRSMQQLIRNAIDLCLLSGNEVSVPQLYDIVNSAPRSEAERESEEWQENSLCWQLLENAENLQDKLSEWQWLDLASTVNYWQEEFPRLAPKTRSGIISMFTSMADNLMRRPFRMLFSVGLPKRNAVPEMTHDGVIIIMNLPVKEFGEAGRAAQVIYKMMWQQAVERRDIAKNPRPVFLWVDEAQNFVTDYDMQFQATARSSRACTVYLTQNLPNYYASMGGEQSKYRVDSLIGNFQTLIFHNNAEPYTNQKASDIIGRSWQLRAGVSRSASERHFTTSESANIHLDYDVIPKTYTRLKKGGRLNGYEVEAIVFNSRGWSNGKTYLRASFHQRKT